MAHTFARATAPATDDDDPRKYAAAFSTGRRTYARQFNELYYARLNELKPHVLAAAAKKWGADCRFTPKVLNVEAGQTAYIVGTVFIDSRAKPSTLDQVEREHWISDPAVGGAYRDGAETVFLEDESGRIELVGGVVDGALLVSGLVAAVLGAETPDGRFGVTDVCFAGMAPQPARPAVPEDRLVALVSGLGARAECPVTLEMQLLAEFLCGTLGGANQMQNQDQNQDQNRDQNQDQNLPPVAARIVQVVVAGNTLSLAPPPLGHTEDARANDRSGAAALVAAVDGFLADIAAAVPLALMPGAHDPADASLPQQPMHAGMFARCAQYSGFRSLSNPALLDVGGCVLLGSSGQNVDDIARYVRPPTTPAPTHAPTPTSTPSPAALAAESLQWRHIAPSAPDTLWCYPFSGRDPFILPLAPHVYF
ncbi:DNA polymerase delta small subunit Cdc1, partial [Coemansia sp. RSA 1836]